MPDLRAARHASAIVVPLPLEHQMEISRSDERESGREAISVNGFSDLEGALAVEAISEGFREYRWNVLHDRDTG